MIGGIIKDLVTWTPFLLEGFLMNILISVAAMAFTAACYLICGRIAGLPLGELPPELWSWRSATRRPASPL